MRCPTLSELPPPPPGKTGWPWTEESPQLPKTMPDSVPWPRVSVVTPSYNQARFIEETIRSVLLQDYTNLEYIIIDGGSTDGSVDIIHKYEDHLAYWVSEPDRGQSHAFNKGWQRATGEIIGWLNSDDVYLPGAIRFAATYLSEHPDVDFVYGDGQKIDGDSKPYLCNRGWPYTWRSLARSTDSPVRTGSWFMRRRALDRVGMLDESLHFSMDYPMWLDLKLHCNMVYLPGCIFAAMRHHSGSKTSSNTDPFHEETMRIHEEMAQRPDMTPQQVADLDWGRANLAFRVFQVKASPNHRQPGAAMRWLLRSIQAEPRYMLGRIPETSYLLARLFYYGLPPRARNVLRPAKRLWAMG